MSLLQLGCARRTTLSPKFAEELRFRISIETSNNFLADHCDFFKEVAYQLHLDMSCTTHFYREILDTVKMAISVGTHCV
jgi:hypothetical protein